MKYNKITEYLNICVIWKFLHFNRLIQIFLITGIIDQIMPKQKKDIEIRFVLKEDRDTTVYNDFIEARDYFKIKDNEVAKMLLIKGIEIWFRKELKGEN